MSMRIKVSIQSGLIIFTSQKMDAIKIQLGRKLNPLLPALISSNGFHSIYCVVANWIARHRGGHSSTNATGRINLPITSASFTFNEMKYKDLKVNVSHNGLKYLNTM